MASENKQRFASYQLFEHPSNNTSTSERSEVERTTKIQPYYLQTNDEQLKQSTKTISNNMKRINPNKFFLAYLLAKLWWKNVIVSFHILKYNKNFNSRKMNFKAVPDQTKTKKIITGLQLFSTKIKKQLEQAFSRNLKLGFQQIKFCYKNKKIILSVRKKRICSFFYKWKKDSKQLGHKKQVSYNVLKRDQPNTAASQQNSKFADFIKNKSKQTHKKIVQQEKKNSSQYINISTLDNRLQQLELLLENTKKMRQVDNERRQKIQDLILQQRINRYMSTNKDRSKSKSRFKETSNKKTIHQTQKSSVRCNSKQKLSSRNSEYYNSDSIQKSKQVSSSGMSGQIIQQPTYIQPIIYHVYQPVYLPQQNPTYSIMNYRQNNMLNHSNSAPHHFLRK